MSYLELGCPVGKNVGDALGTNVGEKVGNGVGRNDGFFAVGLIVGAL